MELKLKIGYAELLVLIKQLPANQLTKLKRELNRKTNSEMPRPDVNSFQEFLLSGPVMTTEQYEQFLLNRQYFNLWRTS